MELQKSIKEEIEAHCKNEKEPVAMLQSGSRRPPLPKLRRAITLKLIKEYGVSLAQTARRLGISTSGVAQILRRSGDVWVCTNCQQRPQHSKILYRYLSTISQLEHSSLAKLFFRQLTSFTNLHYPNIFEEKSQFLSWFFKTLWWFPRILIRQLNCSPMYS